MRFRRPAHHDLLRVLRRARASGWVFVAHMVFALVLLLGQREATLHWLSHATEAATAKHSLLASSDVCDECLSLGGLDAAVHPAPAAIGGLELAGLPVLVSTWVSAQSLLSLGYASRGPPLLA